MKSLKILIAITLSSQLLNCMVETPLIKAVKAGDLNAVNTLLAAKADIEQDDGQGLNPLYFAVLYNHKNIVKTLIDAKADISHALQPAQLNGDVELLKKLVALGADLSNIEEEAIGMAVGHGHAAMLQYLISLGFKVNIGEASPIICAALNNKGYPEVVKILLDNKVDVNYQTEEGYTSLHLAAKAAHHEVIKVLLKHNANVNLDVNGKTPLSELLSEIRLKTISRNNRDNIRELSQLIKDPVLLKKMLEPNVIIGDAKKSLKLLLEYGAEVHFPLSQMPTICETLGVTDLSLKGLLILCFTNAKLFHFTSGIYKTDNTGMTTLMYLCARNNLWLISQIFEQAKIKKSDKDAYPIDLSLTNEDNETVFTLARKHNNAEVVKLLLDYFESDKEKILAVFEQPGLPKLTAIIFMGYLFDTDWV